LRRLRASHGAYPQENCRKCCKPHRVEPIVLDLDSQKIDLFFALNRQREGATHRATIISFAAKRSSGASKTTFFQPGPSRARRVRAKSIAGRALGGLKPAAGKKPAPHLVAQ
jgi:hypothetical protein